MMLGTIGVVATFLIFCAVPHRVDAATLLSSQLDFANLGVFGVGVGSGQFDWSNGVAYTPSSNQNFQSAYFHVSTGGVVSGHIHLELWHSGSFVASSGNVDVAQLPTNSQLVSSLGNYTNLQTLFTFSSGISLVSGQTYYIMVVPSVDLTGNNVYVYVSCNNVETFKAALMAQNSTPSTYTCDAQYSLFDGVAPRLDLTRIISFLPADGTTTPSFPTPVDFSLHAYINSSDIGNFTGVKITFENIDQNGILAGISPYTFTLLDRVAATSSGDFYYATSTPLPNGNYRVTATLEGTTIFGIINPLRGFLGTIDEQVHQFIVGSSTFIGSLSQNSFGEIGSVLGVLPATSTTALAGTCNPLGSFDAIQCLSFLFIPSATQIQSSFSSLYSGVLTHFPLGYVTDFIAILATTTTSAIPVINATVPNGVIGTGAHISLDLAHSLDYILNATSSIYNNASASSTQTLYQITSYYWNILVYVLTGLFILARVLGSHLIPRRSGKNKVI